MSQRVAKYALLAGDPPTLVDVKRRQRGSRSAKAAHEGALLTLG